MNGKIYQLGSKCNLWSLILTVSFLLTNLSFSQDKLRIGHFPNITHTQALIAHQLSDENKGIFEKETGLAVEWYVYNAGPSAMEAIFTGSLDITYVGPNPAINAFNKSHGKEIRVLSLAAKGGSGLIVRPGLDLSSTDKFKGLKIATPQFGNTQDIAARAWFTAKGLKVAINGGELSIIPTENPDQLTLFGQGLLDGCWTVEPWLSRLELEKSGKIFFEDSESLTTLLVVSTRLLKQPELLKKILNAHAQLTKISIQDPVQAKDLVAKQLNKLTGAKLSTNLLDRTFSRIKPLDNMDKAMLEKAISEAQNTGFLKDSIDLNLLVSHEPGK